MRIEEAIHCLATPHDARPLAGGQSRLAMMNFRDVTPAHLVDPNRIAALAGIEDRGDALCVGAPGALDGELDSLLATLAGYDEHAVRCIKGFAGKPGHVDPQPLSDLAGYTLATAFTRPH